MDALSALNEMIRSSGWHYKPLSKRLGRTESYIGSMLSKGTTPTIETFARIADACEYDVFLIPRNHDASVIVIDPPEATS